MTLSAKVFRMCNGDLDNMHFKSQYEWCYSKIGELHPTHTMGLYLRSFRTGDYISLHHHVTGISAMSENNACILAISNAFHESQTRSTMSNTLATLTPEESLQIDAVQCALDAGSYYCMQSDDGDPLLFQVISTNPHSLRTIQRASGIGKQPWADRSIAIAKLSIDSDALQSMSDLVSRFAAKPATDATITISNTSAQTIVSLPWKHIFETYMSNKLVRFDDVVTTEIFSFENPNSPQAIQDRGGRGDLMNFISKSEISVVENDDSCQSEFTDDDKLVMQLIGNYMCYHKVSLSDVHHESITDLLCDHLANIGITREGCIE